MATRITEDGNIRVYESVAGIAGVSSLNDASVSALIKEPFTLDPTSRGWLIGSLWSYNLSNGNIEAI